MAHLASEVASLRRRFAGQKRADFLPTLRTMLTAEDPATVMAAIEIAGTGGRDAAPLVDQLASLLTSPATISHSDSHLYGDSDGKSYRFVEFSGTTSVARAACEAIIEIGVAPSGRQLESIARKAPFSVPVACFDQGFYIGDYVWEPVDPAELVARIRRRIG